MPTVKIGDCVEPVQIIVDGKPATNPTALRIRVVGPATLEHAQRLIDKGTWRIVEEGNEDPSVR